MLQVYEKKEELKETMIPNEHGPIRVSKLCSRVYEEGRKFFFLFLTWKNVTEKQTELNRYQTEIDYAIFK